jgi:drug/metabolite transporter (DMT)-like permease
MSVANLLRLLALAAIWGSSFLFMRIAAPVIGPAWLAEGRVFLAALFLAAVSLWLRSALNFKQNLRHYFILGFFNLALPFLLFAYASKQVTASLLSVINATAPIWGAVIGAILLRRLPGLKMLVGLGLGIFGVTIIVGLDPVHLTAASLLAIGAGLIAAMSYGVASQYARLGPKVEPMANAHGSMWAAVFILLPVVLLPSLPTSAAPMTVTPLVGLSILMLGFVCSGLAFLIYFDLIKKIGAAQTLSVGFLIPVFGVLWGSLILHEPLGWPLFFGGGLVIWATILVTGFKVSSLWRANPVQA